MKYIVITSTPRDKPDGIAIRTPFMFPEMLVHDHVAKAMLLLLSLMFPAHDSKVTSAGEFSSMSFEGECGGESTSIGIKSKPEEDTLLIRMNDYGAGMT